MRARALALVLASTLGASSVHAFEWSGKLEADAKGLKDSNPQRRLQAVQALAEYDIADS